MKYGRRIAIFTLISVCLLTWIACTNIGGIKIVPVDTINENFGIYGQSAPPIISNIQQDPPKDNVGYLDVVNVSCDLEFYASLTAVQINWSKDNWAHYDLVDMTGSGNGTYWGEIPAVGGPGATYRYIIYALDQLGANTSSGEHNYTVIDNYPPTIAHTNSSAWVTPLHPFPTVTTVSTIRWNCTVQDDFFGVSWVKVNYSTNTGLTNVSRPMVETEQFNYTDLWDIPIGVTHIWYNIRAGDLGNNTRTSPQYLITLDSSGPDITSWTAPASPLYNDTVDLYVNATDWNQIHAVTCKWSLDWVTNHSVPLSNSGGDTWQADSPLPVQAWDTTVFWEVNATDDGGFSTISQFSYTTGDNYAPNLVALAYETTLAKNQPNIINVSATEPINASGIATRLLYYGLASEGYAYQPVPFTLVLGDTWTATVPGQEGETVRWYVFIEDNAGNNYTSSVYEYSVSGKSGIPGFDLIPLLIGLLLGLYLIRYLSMRKALP